MRTSTNYHLPLPEGSDEMLIEKVSEGIEGLDGHLGTAANAITNHKADKNNPHNVTKSQIGLGNVENKSSAAIRNEMTNGNVTNALGFTPARSSHSHDIDDIDGLADRLELLETIALNGVHKLVINYTLVNTTTGSSSSGSYTKRYFDIQVINNGAEILNQRNREVTIYENETLIPYIDTYNGEDTIEIAMGIKMNGYKEPWYGHSPWYVFENPTQNQTITIYYSPTDDVNADIIKDTVE